MAAIVGILILAGAVGASACAGGADQPPVASPGFFVGQPRVPQGSPLEVTYRFKVVPNAPTIDRQYRVLVHFLDSDEELMWTDDHDPPKPTTEWRPGETIEYTRTLFLPIYPYLGKTIVLMGLYAPDDHSRLPLVGEQHADRSYRVATIELLPQNENVFLIFKDGWHPAEVAPENTILEWQWTKKDATISFRNPGRDALFYLQYDGRPDLFDGPQNVAVAIGDQVVDSFEVTNDVPVLRKTPMTATQLGSGEMVELKIQVDRTFVPAKLTAESSIDTRELGIRVYHAFIEPKAKPES